MQEADATVETFEPSIPHLIFLKELAVLGFLTLLALLLRPAGPDRDHFEHHARAIPRLVRRRAPG